MDEESYFKVEAPTRSKMEPHREWVNETLTNYPLMKNAVIYDRLKEEYPDLKLNFSAFTKWMQQFRVTNGYMQDKRYYSKVPDTVPGAEAQVDMGQTFLKSVNGYKIKVYFFAMVLSYSRMKYVFFITRPFTSRLFCYAHERAFEYFGGRPEILMYDQDRIIDIKDCLTDAC